MKKLNIEELQDKRYADRQAIIASLDLSKFPQQHVHTSLTPEEVKSEVAKFLNSYRSY